MSDQYYCPNCNATVLSAARDCSNCGATFAEGSAWKPWTKAEAGPPPATTMNLMFAGLGIAMLVATFFPIGARVLLATTGGMYGPIFKPFSPAMFLLVSFVSNYLPLAILACVMLHYFKVMERVPQKYRGGTLFGLGVSLILLYSAARVLAAAVPGGGAGFAVASLSPIIVLPALLLLLIAVIRLCVGYGKGVA
jgi:hypothetical protein